MFLKKQENWDKKFKMVCKNPAGRGWDRSRASPWNKVWWTSQTLVSVQCFLSMQAMGSAGQNYCGLPDFSGYVPVYCCWKRQWAGSVCTAFKTRPESAPWFWECPVSVSRWGSVLLVPLHISESWARSKSSTTDHLDSGSGHRAAMWAGITAQCLVFWAAK